MPQSLLLTLPCQLLHQTALCLVLLLEEVEARAEEDWVSLGPKQLQLLQTKVCRSIRLQERTRVGLETKGQVQMEARRAKERVNMLSGKC